MPHPEAPAGSPYLERLSDEAWLVRFGPSATPEDNARVHALAAGLRASAPGWLVDLVPAYASLGVFFDASRVDMDVVQDALLDHVAEAGLRSTSPHGGRSVEIPVAYGGEFGPDLLHAAESLGMSPEALIRRHSGGHYSVAMIGFAPGFPYFTGLDPALALPRLATPRILVPAGSVAIGGSQTGIYPRASPGGWRILGRTPLVLFDPLRTPPTTLQPGDTVRFRSIDPETFAALAGAT